MGAWDRLIGPDPEAYLEPPECVLHLGNGCSCYDCGQADADELQREIDKEEVGFNG